MSSSPPTTLGKYQIIREIARSNDIVYEGYDPLMTRRVAVKELNMPVGATPQQREDRIGRFKREAQAAGRLNHPNIMTVYDVEEDAGHLFMAMEYLDGGTLRAEVDGAGKLAPARAVEVARAVLAGLEHAHKLGVVHRDIKPDNVQILSNGSIKITDFGIARLTFQPNLTMDGQVFGTPSYMSPEQVVGKEIDPRSDLFSVGVMLYEMLAGHKPFQGDNVITITTAIVNREPEPLPADIPYALGDAVRRSLEKVPSLRFDDAASMASALSEALKPVAQPTYDPPIPSTPTPQGYSPYGAPNPYGTPPVAAPPYGAPNSGAPYSTQPYNPYGTPNPYGAPPVQQAPAPSYGYNPYTQAPYGGPGPTMAPPPTAAPVYYPPPPRQPLLKPETAAFIKKLTIAFVVFGTFFALILVGVWALSQQLSRVKDTRESASITQSIQNIDPNLPLPKQIEELRRRKSHIGPNADTTEIDRALGDRYYRLARQEIDARQYASAEPYLAEAEKVDPHNPDLLVAYGDFFTGQAESRAEPSIERADLYRQASEKYMAARTQESDPKRQASEGVAGADRAFRYAWNAHQTGDVEARRTARQALAEAQAYASGDATLTARIADLLAQMRG